MMKRILEELEAATPRARSVWKRIWEPEHGDALWLSAEESSAYDLEFTRRAGAHHAKNSQKACA